MIDLSGLCIFVTYNSLPSSISLPSNDIMADCNLWRFVKKPKHQITVLVFLWAYSINFFLEKITQLTFLSKQSKKIPSNELAVSLAACYSGRVGWPFEGLVDSDKRGRGEVTKSSTGKWSSPGKFSMSHKQRKRHQIPWKNPCKGGNKTSQDLCPGPGSEAWCACWVPADIHWGISSVVNCFVVEATHFDFRHPHVTQEGVDLVSVGGWAWTSSHLVAGGVTQVGLDILDKDAALTRLVEETLRGARDRSVEMAAEARSRG